MKRILAGIISLCLMISLIPTAAFAESVIDTYAELTEAIAAAQAGETITLGGDITASEIITINKAITLDGANHKLTSTAGRAINIDCDGKVTVQNLTISADERAINIINNPAKVIIEKVTATAKNNAAYIATSAGAVNLTIDKCDFTGLAVVNVAGNGSVVEINDTNLTNKDADPEENYGAITIWSTNTTDVMTVKVKGGHIVVADDSKAAAIFPNASTNTVTFDGTTGNTEIIQTVAMIGDAGYETLAEAVAEANGATIKLVRDVTEATPVVLGKDVTLDLNGKTFKGHVVGTLSVNGGNYVMPEAEIGTLVGPDGKFKSTDGVFAIGADMSTTFISGTVTVGQDWRTLPEQPITVAANAKFIVPSGVVFEVFGDATVADVSNVSGQFTLGGELYGDYAGQVWTGGTITAAEDLDVVSGLADYVVVYEGGVYKLAPAEAKVGNKGYATLEAAFADVKDGDIVTLLNNADIATAIEVTKNVTLDLNGYNITAVNDTVGDGLFHVMVDGSGNGCLTIEGKGTLDGRGNNKWNMALWADGGTINIKSGKYTNVGAKSDKPDDKHFDLIYAKNGGVINIYGGEFECETPRWTLNSNNDHPGTINVYGGKFLGFDPDNTDIDDDSVKVAKGYVSVAKEGYFVIEEIKVEVKAEIPVIDNTENKVQTTIDTENATNEEIASDLAETGAAALENAFKGDETALKEYLGKEPSTELKKAIEDKEEIIAVFTVESEPIDLTQPLPSEEMKAEIVAIKEAMGAAPEDKVEILNITVSTVYKKANGTVLDEVEHEQLAAELTHIVKLPAVPDVAEGMVRIWTMYSYHNGKVEKYSVTDLGDGTGAFASAKYSLYAIGYEDVPEVTEHEHDWSKGWKSDETSHRRYCKTCGATKSKKPHEDLNKDGICDVCEHTTTVSTGRTNPNTGVKF